MDSYPPRFDHLYSVSDLHLGGRPGFQMFSQGRRLAEVIGRLRSDLADDRRLVLVINGDFVDFLAEHPASYFDPGRAVADLNRVMADPAFAPVFDALAAFVGHRNNCLVITLGNHDLELCLPDVQHALLTRLAGDDAAARARIRLVMDGSGFRCRVGRADVLLVHGNETDGWNRVDFGELLAVKSACTSGRIPADFEANVGTRLVIDILNEIKQSYPFVDLLKPEMPVIVAMLYAVVGKKSRILQWMRHLPEVIFGPLHDHEIWAYLDEAEATNPPEQTRRSLRELQDLNTMLAGMATDSNSDALLEAAWQEYKQDDQADEMDEEAEILAELRFRHILPYLPSWMDWIGSPEEKAERLRKTLQNVLREDRSFSLSEPDNISHHINDVAGEGIHFLVAGHTHLYRAIGISARRHYLNSGTWTDVLSFPGDLLEDRQRFFQVFDALSKGAHAADLEKIEPDMVRREYTLAHIRIKDNGIQSELLKAQKNGSLTNVNNSARYIHFP